MLSDAIVRPSLPTTDVDRARSFFTKNLGLRVKRESAEGGIILEAGAGSELYVYPTQAKHGEATAAAFVVKDAEKTIRELRASGVKFEEYDIPGIKTVDGIATIGNAKGGWFKDPDGNVLAVTDMK